MARIRRQSLPKHLLVPDTNILWHDKKDGCASPQFNEFWSEYGSKYEIELVLPEVVKGELMYQHTSSALTTLDRINNQFGNLSSYSNKNYKHRVTAKRVREDIKNKFETWISSISAEVVETPISTIDWADIIQKSIWRNAPFSEEKDKKSEKGFRDALIAETMCHIAESRLGIDTAFISNDRLLIDTVRNRLKSHKTCAFYETLDEFSSYLRLLDEKLTNEFVQVIQKRARDKFHSEKDSNCLIYKNKIVGKIKEDFSDEFATPVPTASLRNGLLGGISQTRGVWKEYSKEGIWIRAPGFIQLENENEFIWDSRIIFVQLFQYEGPSSGTLLTGTTSTGQENLRTIEFKVTWSVRVGKDASFRRMQVSDIEFEKDSFEPATDEEKERYSVEPISE